MKKLLLIATTFIVTGLSAQWTTLPGPFQADIQAIIEMDQKIFAVDVYRGVLHSSDGGNSWTYSNQGLPINAIAFYSLDHHQGELFLGSTKGLYHSKDSAKTWTLITSNLPTWAFVYSAAKLDSTLVIATGSGIFHAHQDSLVWDTVKSGIPANTRVFDLYELNGDLYAATSRGLFESSDKGENWDTNKVGLPQYHQVNQITGNAQGIMLASTGGVFFSNDSAQSWQPRYNGILDSVAFAIGADQNQFYVCNRKDVFASGNQGQTWKKICTGRQNHFWTIHNYNAVAPIGNTVWIGGINGLEGSIDSGSTWNRAKNGIPSDELVSISSTKERVYVGGRNAFYQWNETEGEWTKKLHGNISSFAVEDSHLLAGIEHGSIMVSADNGNSWTRSMGFFDNTQDIVGYADSTVFARVNLNFGSPGTSYISKDKGFNFVRETYPYLLFDTDDQNHFYALDQGKVFAYESGSWIEKTQTYGTEEAHSIAAHKDFFAVGLKGEVALFDRQNVSWSREMLGDAGAVFVELLDRSHQIIALNSHGQVFISPDKGANWTDITGNYNDSLIPARNHGVYSYLMTALDTVLYVAGKQGVSKRSIPMPMPLGSEEYSIESEWQLYPNPTRNKVNLISNEEATWEIRNASGKLVLQPEIGTQIQFDLASLQAGIYWISRKTKDSNTYKKLILAN